MRTRTRNLKRLLSLLLCTCMVAGLLPTAVLAADAPAITTRSLAEAAVGEEYTAQLTATASDQDGALTWEAEGLPNGLALTGSGETVALLGTPTEAGTFIVTVAVTETIPAAEPEEPAAQEAGPDGVTEPAGESQPTVLTASRTYTLTVAEPANEPANEPPANAPLTDDGSTRTTYQSVNATIYTGQGSYGEFTGETSTFAVDKAGLILDLRNFNTAVLSTWAVESIAFYPTDGSSQWGTVFWYDGTGEYFCDNGTPNDKLAENGVFQLLKFTPNGSSGSAGLTPGTYKILVYVGNGLDYPNNEETLYLSNETFTITAAAGPGVPVITTATLPDATVGVSYETPLAAAPATGGTLSWALASGSSLPAGLTLGTDGTIYGTPTTAGSSTFTVQVTETPTEGETLTATKELTLTVKEAAGPTITTMELPMAFVGESYTAQVAATASSGGTLS